MPESRIAEPKKAIRVFFTACAVIATHVPNVCAQDAAEGPKPGTPFLQGGVMITSLLGDTQDTKASYRHYAFIGTLDWPALGATFGGGAFVARHVSVGAELALRRQQSTAISEREYEISAHGERTSVYTSREHLFSVVLRVHTSLGRRVDVQPLGGVTRSWSSQSLTERSGFFFVDGRAPVPITAPDATLKANKWGIAVGADVGLPVGGGVAIICSPRFHWIHRDEYASYDHVVPNASRTMASIAAGVQWRPRLTHDHN